MCKFQPEKVEKFWMSGNMVFSHAVLSGSVYIGTKTYSPFLFLPCCTNRMKSDKPPVGVLKLKYLSPWKPGFWFVFKIVITILIHLFVMCK